MNPQARAWLAQEALDRMWDRLRDRLERNGIEIRGRLQIPDPTYAEREALSMLVGRRFPPGAAVSIALPDLDARLRSSAAACGLVTAVTELRGPLASRPAAADARRSARQQVDTAALDALQAAGLSDAPWAEAWLADVRRGGALSRLDPRRGAALMTQAVAVLARLLPGPGRDGREAGREYARGELAERITGTAHGLDDDTLLAKVVLRALAGAFGTEPPTDARCRRELWEMAGAATDRVSSTVLTYGLTPLGNDWPARWLRQRARACAETHLTMRDLGRAQWQLEPGTEVFVCENPRVVEAAADASARRWLVCTAGNPATIVIALLDALVAAGATLAYRGDFDWPGIAIANRMMQRYAAAARPWRMDAADYAEHTTAARRRGTPLQPLAGAPVEATWDAELTPAMSALGLAVQEESALELIVADLLCG
jgi:uncharacterized protein (TIGR02679 family)